MNEHEWQKAVSARLDFIEAALAGVIDRLGASAEMQSVLTEARAELMANGYPEQSFKLLDLLNRYAQGSRRRLAERPEQERRDR